jgi:hypothetical protein
LQATSADVSSELRAIDYDKGRMAAFDKMFQYWLKNMVEFYSLYCALGFNVAASNAARIANWMPESTPAATSITDQNAPVTGIAVHPRRGNGPATTPIAIKGGITAIKILLAPPR